jgi:hypothetical protein
VAGARVEAADRRPSNAGAYRHRKRVRWFGGAPRCLEDPQELACQLCGGGLRKIVQITNDVIEGVGLITKGSDDTMKAFGSLAALRACDPSEQQLANHSRPRSPRLL